MTQKELLYMEDAINHEQSIISICKDLINNLKDDNLISFIKKEIRKHTTMYELLIQTMEDSINE